MNDEELRAFLESATEGGDEDQRPETGASSTTAAGSPAEGSPAERSAADAAASADSSAAPPRRGVPSFDELMQMGVPAAPSTPVTSRSSTAPAPAAPATAVRPPVAQLPANQPPAAPAAAGQAPAAPVQPVAPSAEPAGSATDSEWSQTYAQEDEQLVPLILPGFSPEPHRKTELPPVFQAEQPVAAEPLEDPAPTQPFDVIADEQASAAVSAATTPLATTSVSAAPIGAAPRSAVPAAATSAATSVAATPPTAEIPASEDPFAILAPELAATDHAATQYETQDETQDEDERVEDREKRGRRALPWLIVSSGALVAILASIFLINGVRGTEQQTPEPTPTTTTEPAEPETPETQPEPSAEPTAEPDTVPVIDPGSTWTLPIDQWNLNVQVSEKLGGRTPYTLFEGNSKALFDSVPIASGFSDSCAAAREPNVWGLLKKEDGTLEVVRPMPRCAGQNDAALYETIWGVLDHMAKSAKPS